MYKHYRCFTNQNYYAYTYVEMAIAKGKASYYSAYK